MNYRSHRHDDCCESREPYCQPPISWPQRPSLPNFPGIATFWPMPFALPMLPSMGSWGGMGSGCEPPEYSHRRHDMYLYRCCKPRYGRHAQCCERCGEYDCRCERRCERCGEYDCRCERRCERCGRRDCRCGLWARSGGVRFTVINGTGFNFAISMDPDYFDANAALTVNVLTEGLTGKQIDNIGVNNSQGAIEIVLTLPDQKKFPTTKGYYLGSVYDSRRPNDGPIAYLKIHIY
jgi:hypothetical protein